MVQLQREISYKVLLLIVINSIMGTGIFFLPAIGAQIAGPASIISWVILSFVSIYMAMCFAELTSMFPSAGGVYEFCKESYGRFWSFIIGWTTFIAGNITIAMLIIGAIQYLLPFHLPLAKVMISIVFILLFNYVAYRGIKTSATMLVAFAFITLFTIITLIIPSLFRFDASNLSPFFVFPMQAIYFAVFFISETFFGWESPTFLAGETKDGRRVVPKAIVVGTVCITIISLVFVISSLGAVKWTEFGTAEAPLSFLAGFHYGPLGVDVFTILVYLSIIGSVAGWTVAAPRLILSMAKDKLFLQQTAQVHHIYKTPYKAIIFQTAFSIIFVLLAVGNYQVMLEMLLPMLILLYSAVLLSVVRLRFKRPNIKRYYKVPFGKVGPIIVIIFLFSLLFTWVFLSHDALNTIKNMVSFILIGIPLYFLIEMYYDPSAIRLIQNILAYQTLLTEQIALPQKVRKEIIRLMGNMKDKIVLEFGCSVGTLTLQLAEEVGKKGKIYATDISETNITIARRRNDKKGNTHVITLHDSEHHNRVHPGVPRVEVVVSVGMMGYVQDVSAVLSDINKRLYRGHKVCFVEYDKLFDILPTAYWLSDDRKIKRICKKHGFKVHVERKQGFAWKYIFIYGEKVRDI